MGYPSFTAGDVLAASDMNAVGLWLNRSCTVTSVGGSAATASDGVITVGTGNTTITVSSAFSSTYQNYKIEWNFETSSATANIQFQFNGTTGSTYYTNAMYMAPASAAMTGYGPAATTNIVIGFTASSNVSSGTIEIYNPNNSALRTTMVTQCMTNANFLIGGGLDATTTAHTGFNLTFSGGASVTGGKIRVYGFRN